MSIWCRYRGKKFSPGYWVVLEFTSTEGTQACLSFPAGIKSNRSLSLDLQQGWLYVYAAPSPSGQPLMYLQEEGEPSNRFHALNHQGISHSRTSRLAAKPACANKASKHCRYSLASDFVMQSSTSCWKYLYMESTFCCFLNRKKFTGGGDAQSKERTAVHKVSNFSRPRVLEISSITYLLGKGKKQYGYLLLGIPLGSSNKERFLSENIGSVEIFEIFTDIL